MDYFFKSVLGTAQPEVQPTPAETVERLVERLQSSTLLEDRRDACRALKSLSRKHRLEVGAQGLDGLTSVLKNDQLDVEILSYSLDTLCNLTSPEPFPEEDSTAASVGAQLAEMFLKRGEPIPLLLCLLEEYNFHVRLPIIRLLTHLLHHMAKDVQEAVLISPMGVSKLMDLLSDSRDFVRTEALLLIGALCKGHTAIQKIVAFENGFERLLALLDPEGEGGSDGGVVIEDALHVLYYLLKNNASNQTFFREGAYMKRLVPFLTHAVQTSGTNSLPWSSQKSRNVSRALDVVRSLIWPAQPAQTLLASQKGWAQAGLMPALCSLLLGIGVPSELLAQVLCTLAELMRGCAPNQEEFTKVQAPSNPPRSALVLLLLSMVNDKQPLALRCAVLYVCQCYLYNNPAGQDALVATLLPTSSQVSDVSAGQLLCGGLLSSSPMVCWLSASALSHALHENNKAKEQLLRVQLATSPDAPATPLMQQELTLLQAGGHPLSRLAHLNLLCSWCVGCPQAVSLLLRCPGSVTYLVAVLGTTDQDEGDTDNLVQGVTAFLLGLCVLYNPGNVPNCNKDALITLVAKRLGTEAFLDKLSQVGRHLAYTLSSKSPQPTPSAATSAAANPDPALLIDFHWCKLYKSLEANIVKAMTPEPAQAQGAATPAAEEVAAQYKEVIREQDAQLQHLRQRLAALEIDYLQAKTQVEELSGTVSELRDQNALQRAQVLTGGSGAVMREIEAQTEDNHLQQIEELQELRRDNNALRFALDDRQHIISDLEDRLREAENKPVVEVAANPTILDSFKAPEEPVFSYFRGETPPLQASQDAVHSEVTSLKAEMDLLRNERDSLRQEVETLKSQQASYVEERSQLLHKLKETETALATDEKPAADFEQQLESLRKEQEDLLLLLSDQDTQLRDYRQRLRQLGHKVEDDDEDDFEAIVMEPEETG